LSRVAFNTLIREVFAVGCFVETRTLAGLAVSASLVVLATSAAGHAAPQTAPGTFVVNSVIDNADAAPGDGVCATSAGDCTLRAAVQESNALTGARAITLPAGTYVLTVAGREETSGAAGDLNLTSNAADITINGAGAATTIIDANRIDRAFKVNGGALTLADLAVQNGVVSMNTPGGCLLMSSGRLTLLRTTIRGCEAGDGGGGGIYAGDITSPNPTVVTMTITDSTIAHNRATGPGGGLYLASASGTVTRTAIYANTASLGGGLFDVNITLRLSALTIANSTISANTGTESAGGVYYGAWSGRSLSLMNVTIAANSSERGAALTVSSGTRVSSGGRLFVRNTIIASSVGSAPNNCVIEFGIVESLGNNIEYPGTTCGFTHASDNRVDPALGPLGAYGGPTQTHDLRLKSPAIDGGDSSTCAASPISGVDQRDLRRSGSCDIGAYEFDAATAASLDRRALAMAAVSNGSAFLSQTPPRSVRITPGLAAVTWTATADKPWLTVSPASGSGAGTLTISPSFHASLPANGTVTGTVTVTLTGARNSVDPIAVTLTVVPATGPASPPFGSFDTPAGDATMLAGSFGLTGWALDNIGVKRVELWRDLQTGETTPPFLSPASDPRHGKVFIATATFVDGARPDVEMLYSTAPMSDRAGWGYLLLSYGLASRGNGTYNLYAFAFDQEDNVATLGVKTVIVNNAAATKPFGNVDMPAGAATVSGTAVNFGWALTPNVSGSPACRIPASGVQVSIDSGPLQPVVYGDARSDIAAAFPGFSNSDGAGGHYILDTTLLANGRHTLDWVITDDCNRSDGIGSRFFTVSNGASLVASPAPPSALRESGLPLLLTHGVGELPRPVRAETDEPRTVEIRQGERIELRMPRGFERAYQQVNGQPRELPVGSTWDAAGGILYWQPAPGFLGRFQMVFVSDRERISVRVVVTR
jgi:CSLREA domain-containing protein